MLERRNVVGGAAVTEEFHPGFRNSVASLHRLAAQSEDHRAIWICRRHGLRSSIAKCRISCRSNDREYLIPAAGAPRTKSRNFPQSDAERIDAYNARLSKRWPTGARELILETPPNVTNDGWTAALPRDSSRARRSAGALARSRYDGAARSAGAVRAVGGRHGWTAGSKAIRSRPCSASTAIVGNYATPYAPGTAYVLLHHVLRRSERQEGRVGPRHRRHGRHHAGDGEGVRGDGVEIRTD